jgi:signal peptidase I
VTSEDRDHATAVAKDEPGRSASRSSRTSKRKHLPLWQETILLLGIALLLAVVIKALFVQAFYIPSESMEPGLVRNDRILVQKMSYWFGGSPERGDVVVFKDPGGWLNPAESVGPANPVAKVMAKIGLYPQGGHLVKRVIGVEGDVIKCCDKRGRISVNGTALNEGLYAKDESGVACRGPMPGGCDWKAGPVPEGHIFVMGDNRNHSADSTSSARCSSCSGRSTTSAG